MRTAQNDEVSTTLWLLVKEELKKVIPYARNKNAVMTEHTLHQVLHVVQKILEIENDAAIKYVEQLEKEMMGDTE